MIRFVDLSEVYWTDPECGYPLCAFLSTSSDRFLDNLDGEHLFRSLEEIGEHPQKERLLGLLPAGFFEKAD